MKVIFFGSGDFALPSLQSIRALPNIEIVAVVTQPDRPVGRKQVLQPTPVKVLAQQLDMPVFDHLAQLPSADLAVVVYYGQLIPAAILSQFTHGVVNVHPSLLPRWRGPSPIRSALLADDVETGVSIMLLDAGMDTGPILTQETLTITTGDTNETLEKKLAVLGAALLSRTLPAYLAGSIQPIAQSIEGVTVSKLIRSADGELQEQMSQRELWNRYRAMQPWPGVYFNYQGKRYKIKQAHFQDERFICDMIQPENKSALTLADFKRGYAAVSFADIV